MQTQTKSQTHLEIDEADLWGGLLFGFLAGVLFGLLFAPKSGRELQNDVQRLVDRLPDELDRQWSHSKVRYWDLLDKTKDRLENKIEQRKHRKQALRLANAKRREEADSGTYEY